MEPQIKDFWDDFFPRWIEWGRDISKFAAETTFFCKFRYEIVAFFIRLAPCFDPLNLGQYVAQICSAMLWHWRWQDIGFCATFKRVMCYHSSLSRADLAVFSFPSRVSRCLLAVSSSSTRLVASRNWNKKKKGTQWRWEIWIPFASSQKISGLVSNTFSSVELLDSNTNFFCKPLLNGESYPGTEAGYPVSLPSWETVFLKKNN